MRLHNILRKALWNSVTNNLLPLCYIDMYILYTRYIYIYVCWTMSGAGLTNTDRNKLPVYLTTTSKNVSHPFNTRDVSHTKATDVLAWRIYLGRPK